MAVLNKIRKRSFFLILIIALALFSFVLADLIRGGGTGSQKSQNTVATVNGVDVDRIDFSRKIEVATRNLGGNVSNIQAMNYAWNQELRTLIFDEQFEDLGIKVGKDQINDLLEKALVNNPTFHNEDGFFDKAKMHEYVANIKATSPEAYQQWLDYEISLGKKAQEEVFLTLVQAGVGVTLKEGEVAYKMENDKVDIKYVQLPFTSIKDEEVTVSDDEIKSYITKNEEAYKVEASADLQYVLFKEEPSQEDKDAAVANTKKYLNNMAEFNEETKATDTILGLKNTTDYEAFVNEYSDVAYDDRFVFKKDLSTSVADTLYTLPKGATYGPYTDGEYTKISKLVARKMIPDSVKASHILISWEGLRTAGEITRTKEQAKIVADSIFNIVKNDTVAFKDLAAKYSADTSNKDKGGDLGYFGPNAMVTEFNNYCFDNRTGDKGIVETQFGYHIIKIQDQKNLQNAVQLATVALKVEPSEKTINTIFTETTKFQMESKDSDFEKVAKAKNYSIQNADNIKELDENIPGVEKQRAVVQWAFNTEEAAVGDVKRFDVKDGYIVVKLTNRGEKGTMNVADAKDKVKPILIKEKKAELLKNKIKATKLSEIATNQKQSVKSAISIDMKSPTISGAGTEPVVIGTAFGLEEGQTSAPIIGNNGVYVIEVTKKTPASGLESYKSYAAQITKASKGAVSSKVYTALKDAAEIEDRRAKFY